MSFPNADTWIWVLQEEAVNCNRCNGQQNESPMNDVLGSENKNAANSFGTSETGGGINTLMPTLSGDLDCPRSGRVEGFHIDRDFHFENVFPKRVCH
jgi:hypothetical protein